MNRIYLLLFILFSSSVIAQNGEIKGTVKDPATGETIVGASVMYAKGKGAVTDINGNFSIKIDSAGEYTLTISYVGYGVQTQKVKVANKPVVVNFDLKSSSLEEVEVVADVARTRETPIAFSNVSSKQIEEELGARDLPMILNSTPGVYATEQGGGTGDARVNVRGFEQNTVAVMVDGVPVNDMENGNVFWSNWSGLKDITRSIQIQRGLGASKLSIPSVGGTINIITKGIDEKRSAFIKQEVNDFGLYKTGFGFNSGQLKGGWGFTVGGFRQYGNGWADGTYSDEWAYVAKVQKRFKKHLFTISVNGTPQSHGMRYSYLPIAVYNKSFAEKLGINTDVAYATSTYTTPAIGERGMRYNPDWGTITGDGGTSEGKPGFLSKPNHGSTFNNSVNYYNKPAFNLSHFWTPNDKLTVSTILYLSIGTGGRTGLKVPIAPLYNTTGLLNVQQYYDDNATSFTTQYSTTEHSAKNYLSMIHNDHFWYGGLSSWNYKVNKNLSAFIGIDARYYQGKHYQSVYNLMGADYATDIKDYNQPSALYQGDPNSKYAMKRIGDKVSYYNGSKVLWGGLFAQVEYKKDKWTAFITASIADKGYQRIDYFARKDLLIPGNNYAQVIGWGDDFYYNGSQHLIASAKNHDVVAVHGDTTFVGNKYILNATKYNSDSPEAKTATTDFKWFLGYTVKGGTNYNINDHHNVFINLGYMNMAPAFNNVFDNSNHLYLNVKNQLVYAIEAGYGLKHQKVAANINLYYTIWNNKPFSGVSPDGTSYNINGLNALHKGVELDFIYKLMKNLVVDGIVSIGDWKTTSGSKSYITDQNGRTVDSVDFSAKNVHVGNAAQIQYGGSIKYTVIKGLYIKPRFTYFAKNYANFDPKFLVRSVNATTGAVTDNRDRDSWKMPNYGLLDMFIGYGFKVWKMQLDASAGVLNALNTIYISDAKNAGNFDAASANVYMGLGRRITASLKIGF